MNLEIRPVAETDYATAHAVFNRAFGRVGSRLSEMAFIQALQPDGRFLAIIDGKAVGLVGMIDYGRVAYIGSLAVLPEHQGHGIGAALMDYIIAQVKARGPRIILLEATPAGAHIYRRLGFAVDGTTNVYRLEKAPVLAPPPFAATHMRMEDIADVTAFDAPIFGDQRVRVLKAYLQALPERAFVVRSDQGLVSGYLFAQAGRLGPWAARGSQDAEALHSAAMSLPYEQAPVVVMPAINTIGTELLKRNGFAFERSMLHMRLGGDSPAGQRSSLYALATPGIG